MLPFSADQPRGHAIDQVHIPSKITAEQFWDLAAGDHAVFDQIVTEDFQAHFAAGSGEVLGVAGVKEMTVDLHAAMHGFQCRIDDLVAEGDKVVARVTYSGDGAAISKILILRLHRGQVAEVWEDFDPLPILRRNPASRRA
jgi:SnoaL-like polyketide cyclase